MKTSRQFHRHKTATPTSIDLHRQFHHQNSRPIRHHVQQSRNNKHIPTNSPRSHLTELDALFNVNVREACVACDGRTARERLHRLYGERDCSKGGSKRTDYVMSKHTLLGLVRSASTRLGVYGVRVNCVSPSAVLTPLAKRSLESTEWN
ncbi:putative oxidoreductase [Helianthus annuus]|nr:putative oxidoreductase [Helianthus annuus]